MIAFLSRLFRRPRAGEPAWIDAADLQRRIASGDAVVLVDVRQPEEFTSPPGHLPDAINVPLGDLPAWTADLAARRQAVVLVCTAGANLPCGKANASRTSAGAAKWCRNHPSSAFVPAVATGHDTIYQWRCHNGRPEIVHQTSIVDSRGFAATYWKPLRQSP